MLLLHQAGSVKIGEVVRYTVTYTPAHDRILPSPSVLALKIKNTSALALRAAFIHGPYTLYAAAYPSTFSTDTKCENPRREGVPEYEPNLKAGGTFTCELKVPADVRKSAGTGRRDGRVWEDNTNEVKSVSWIIEVSSQIIFSTSAAVHYEILLGRDERSLNLGVLGNSGPAPGQISDHQQSQGAKDGRHAAQPKGVYSKAIRVVVDDTASLWNTPQLPEWHDMAKASGAEAAPEKPNKDTPADSVMKAKDDDQSGHKRKRPKKVHLVVLTHGLHSNLGADMLFLKESIDAASKQAKIDAKARRAKRRAEEREKASKAGQEYPEHHGSERKDDEGKQKAPADQREENTDESDDEEVVVRGFSGNATRTERGIKYLGKRLAKYVLNMTYPSQPYRPVTKSAASALSNALKHDNGERSPLDGRPSHKDSTIIESPFHDPEPAFKITSISFIAHSLGGLIQTYAIAYIQKHSPQFFDIIKPINFIALASPFLGLSNENPLYVKFALDFGLVGRTGQDLGLTWRPPTIARSGWGAIVGGIGESAHKKIDGEIAPEAKPLLRILPTGPAHTVLKKFRNRTVYSNVVNDGIVPLRTSCLLFLDWQGLGRVEKARRENGLVGTMAEWGWAEITGANSNFTNSPRRSTFNLDDDSDHEGDNTPTRHGHGTEVPQPPADALENDDARSLKSAPRSNGSSEEMDRLAYGSSPGSGSVPAESGPLASILGFFKPASHKSNASRLKAAPKIYKRSQTIHFDEPPTPTIATHPGSPGPSKVTTGDDETENPDLLSAPPKTTFFESAGDLLKPPLPSVEFLIDPSSRPRTIFHDRVYHPSDIPPPPMKRRSAGIVRRFSSQAPGSSMPTSPNPGIAHESSELSTRDYDDPKNQPDRDPRDVVDSSAMKVEEKIARAYHRDLSWRKVLVRLEPDAHNNMIVRRMFANAYGWPVVKHLVDTHFSDAAVATTRDEDEANTERAKASDEGTGKHGEEVNDDQEGRDVIAGISHDDSTDSDAQESRDAVSALNPPPKAGSLGKALANAGSSRDRPRVERADSAAGTWSDRDFADSAEDSEDETTTANSTSNYFSTQLSGGKKPTSPSWKWTEAIVGRGTGLSIPKETQSAETNGTKQEGIMSPVDPQLQKDAALGRRLLKEYPPAPGLGLRIRAPSEEGTDTEEGVTESVARLSMHNGEEPGVEKL
ncbi:hypothetical protein BP6252_05788 [Coleophoma cylindrospora]|uniref:DUF676 domain-containing protein n=1 Tax=Coleophoma cylindrospora TaxID=1849047 RepID=A0A3D8RUQ3_9HELO|nr:hypothetical protein BP6252_05788 [Coleophoma cylindrospora]